MAFSEAARERGDLPQGWGWPGNSKRAHYFRAGSARALCGQWMYTGPRSDDHHKSLDNCRECMRRREKMAGRGASSEDKNDG